MKKIQLFFLVNGISAIVSVSAFCQKYEPFITPSIPHTDRYFDRYLIEDPYNRLEDVAEIYGFILNELKK